MSRVRLAQLNLRGMVKVLLEDVCADVLRSAKTMGVQTSGIIRLPTKTTKYSVLRSPFVNKGAQDQVRRHGGAPPASRRTPRRSPPLSSACRPSQFETKQHGRLIEVYGAGPVSEDATKVVNFMRYLEHTVLPAHRGAARARIMLFSDEKHRVKK
eukprot:3366429-Prymnesium_polylepis.1